MVTISALGEFGPTATCMNPVILSWHQWEVNFGRYLVTEVISVTEVTCKIYSVLASNGLPFILRVCYQKDARFN